MYMFCLHITRFPALLWICRWRPRASVYFFFTRTAILVLQCFELDNKSVYLTTYPCLFDCSAIEITYLILPGSTMSKAPNELIELKDRMKLCTQLVSTAMVCPIWCRFSRGSRESSRALLSSGTWYALWTLSSSFATRSLRARRAWCTRRAR